jgi:acetyl-CoA C-acetyltransferase
MYDADKDPRFLIPRTNPGYGKFTSQDSLEKDGLTDAYDNSAMGNCGEHIAEKYNITRESQDAHAIESYKRADRAWKAGAYEAEVAPVTIKGKKGDTVVKEDEEYKRVIFEKIPTLNPSFKKQGGTITPANSSSLNDGASALILMSAEKAKELGIKPLAKVICRCRLHFRLRTRAHTCIAAYSDAGVAPIDFPIAPTVALPKALEKAKLTADDITLWEINEAFSVVVRASEQILKISPEKINVNGYVFGIVHIKHLLTIIQWRCCSRPRHWQLGLTYCGLPGTCSQVGRVRRSWHLQWSTCCPSPISNVTDRVRS